LYIRQGRRNFEKKNFSKIHTASVDLQFYGLAKKVKQLNRKYRLKLSPEMKFVKATKSAALRIEVPPVNTKDSFEDQKNTLIYTLHKAKILYDWALENY
jgi:hypothetical protein